MAIVLALTVLLFAMQTVADQAFQRLAHSKHQEAARWLAVSGLDFAEAEVLRGRAESGQSWNARFQQGTFRAEVQRMGDSWTVISVGQAASAKFEMRREVRP